MNWVTLTFNINQAFNEVRKIGLKAEEANVKNQPGWR